MLIPKTPVYPAPGTSIVVNVRRAEMSVGVWAWIKPTFNNTGTSNAKLRKDVIAEVRQAAKEEEQNRADCCHFASRRNCRQAAKVCDVEILRRYDVRRVE